MPLTRTNAEVVHVVHAVHGFRRYLLSAYTRARMRSLFFKNRGPCGPGFKSPAQSMDASVTRRGPPVDQTGTTWTRGHTPEQPQHVHVLYPSVRAERVHLWERADSPPQREEQEVPSTMPAGRPRPGRRCRAHRSDGAPCGAYAIVGATVCRAHGGAAPQVRRAAARRLAEAEAYRRLWVEAPQFLARLAEEDRARREWVAEVLGDFDADDPRASCGWHYAAAHFISGQRARDAEAEGTQR